eukprot:1274889-Prymnesium_polylepis.2
MAGSQWSGHFPLAPRSCRAALVAGGGPAATRVRDHRTAHSAQATAHRTGQPAPGGDDWCLFSLSRISDLAFWSHGVWHWDFFKSVDGSRYTEHTVITRVSLHARSVARGPRTRSDTH